MVGDNHFDPEAAGKRHLVDGGDPAIDGEKQLDAVAGEALHRRSRESIAVLARRQVQARLGAERAQGAREDRGRADTVYVVVAMDRDAGAARDMSVDEIASRTHSAE